MAAKSTRSIASHLYNHFTQRDAAFEFIASDVVFHTPLGLPPTREGWRRTRDMLLRAFPNIHLIVEDQLEDGDKVVTRWIAHGTHRGEIMGIQPTGKRVTISGISIDRVAEDTVVAHWEQFDGLAMLQ